MARAPTHCAGAFGEAEDRGSKRHIQSANQNGEELSKCLAKVTIAEGVVGTRDQAHLARRTRWSGGFLACELLPDVGLLQDMRGSSFSRVIELWSSTQTDQSPWAEWVHATYVRRFRRAGSAGEFGEEGACCSRGLVGRSLAQ